MARELIVGGDGVPPEPEWTEIYSDAADIELARKLWGVTIREMRERETLVVANGAQIERYCRASVLYEQASRKIEDEGPVVRGEKGESYSPWWAIMKDADGRATQHEADLGISPRRRAAVGKVGKKARQPRAADEFLKAV